MTFYSTIAKHYEHIFPVGKSQLKFITDTIGNPPQNLIDIACGDGGYAVALAAQGYIVTAIDSNKEMIHNAKEKAELNQVEIATLVGSMDELNKQISGTFDAAICIGNSLVHLDTKERILLFLTQLKGILSEKGQAILQIVNYDRILKHKVLELPLVENKAHNLRFERSYELDEQQQNILFHTTLDVDGEQTKNTIELLPLVSAEMEKLLAQAGLKIKQTYGDFSGESYDAEKSFHYIVVITK